MPRRIRAKVPKKRQNFEYVFFLVVSLHVMAAWFLNFHHVPSNSSHPLFDAGLNKNDMAAGNHQLGWGDKSKFLTKQDVAVTNNDITNAEDTTGTGGTKNTNNPNKNKSLDLYQKHPSEQIEFPVTFRANAGLGHRLGRQSAFYQMAKGLNLKSFISDWGQCEKNDESVHIWQYLFGDDPQLQVIPADPSKPPLFPFLKSVTAMPRIDHNSTHSLGGHYREARILGDTPGYVAHTKSKRRWEKDFFMEKLNTDYEMYKAVVDRFQFYDEIESFKETYQLSQHTVIGLHIRAGNGERGDFRKKKRHIDNIDQWIQNVGKRVSEMVQSNNDPRFKTDDSSKSGKPPLVFLATDTHSLIPALSDSLSNFSIPVVTFEQKRIKRQGIASQGRIESVTSCLDTWKTQVVDAILLGESDICVTGTYSSYTQTIPLSFQMHRAAEAARNSGSTRQRLGTFCEIGGEASRLDCYDNYFDWFKQNSPLPVIGDDKGPKQHVRREVLFLHEKRLDIPHIWKTLFNGTGLILEFQPSR